jgi:GAF domain-containing protein
MLPADIADARASSLEMIELGAPLRDVLTHMVRRVEAHAPKDCVAAILLLDAESRLRTGAAPEPADDYNRAVDGLQPSPQLGTCAKAAATGQVVLTPNIAEDPNWATLKSLPLSRGLVGGLEPADPRPRRPGAGHFGAYFRTLREPSDHERRLVEVLAEIAAVAIEQGPRA